MHFQTLSSGSNGNSSLVRAGDTHVLLDAGLPLRELEERLEAARVAPRRIAHIALTHGHLDHARSAGLLARKTGARVHCCESLMRNASLRKAPLLARLSVGGRTTIPVEGGSSSGEELVLESVAIPHDADPTVAFRLEHRGRVAVLVTDMGRVARQPAQRLAGAHVLLLEFNHELELLQHGPYSPQLKRRIAGPHGHLSNDEACAMLRLLIGPQLHTLVLAHLSEVNNTPERALAKAHATLRELGRADVRVLVAGRDAVGPNLEV